MAAKSTYTPATTKASPRRKAKSVSKSQSVQLTPAMIKAHAHARAQKEFNEFLNNHSRAEMRVVGHLRRCDFKDGTVGLMKEIRRLLGESAARCKAIPFPIGGRLNHE